MQIYKNEITEHQRSYRQSEKKNTLKEMIIRTTAGFSTAKMKAIGEMRLSMYCVLVFYCCHNK